MAMLDNAELCLPEQIARRFHEAYELLAPNYGYETREASAVPWDDVPAQNRHLMIAVVATLIADGTIMPVAEHVAVLRRLLEDDGKWLTLEGAEHVRAALDAAEHVMPASVPTYNELAQTAWRCPACGSLYSSPGVCEDTPHGSHKPGHPATLLPPLVNG